ncbi:phage tail protein [Kitasatospora sp. NPDC002040]|uniref:phage distal tail protein n=1 Tax=Kitasatospora sp. NPDC002040 TaxID=3154661 RepID=UPI00331DF021
MADNPTAPQDPGSLITRDGQLQWGDLLMGPGTRYQIAAEGLTGWHDLPGMDLGDSPRAAGHGALPGVRLAQARTVGAVVLALPGRSPDPDAPWDPVGGDDDPAGSLAELRYRTGLSAGEQWLAVRLHGAVRAVRARVSGRVTAVNRQYASAGLARMTLQWVCTDPHVYSQQEYVARTPVRREGGRVGYPLAYPLAYGTAGVSGAVAVLNGGNVAARPRLTLTGPVTNPRIRNAATGRVLEYRITLTERDRLTVDTGDGTVTLNNVVSRLGSASPRSTPEQDWTLVPGANQVEFSDDASDSAAGLVITWRDADL